MGRLFWKFFIMFWLAQMFTSLGVGLAIWALRPELPQRNIPSIQETLPAPHDMHGHVEMPPLGMPFAPPHERSLLPPLLPILAGSGASVFFAAILAWYFSRPIRTLRSAFDAVANGKLDTRIGSGMDGRKDELADLGQDFDYMAARLQGLMEAQRRLLHDISHELRSPLARLQAVIDLIQQQPDRAAELILRLERDTGRIDSLVGELLTLARLDSGIGGRSMSDVVDLRELLEQVISDASFEAESKQCVVQPRFPDSIPVKGDQELLFRALENVVRNAVLHSPPGKEVKLVVLRDSSDRWVITVADQGPGVPPSDMETIFQPFFRSKTSTTYSGYGLGLAITQRVVQVHGGSVTAANRAQGGLLVTITLPAA